VLSQPGLPVGGPVAGGWAAGKRAALGLDREDLTRVRERTRDGLCVLGLRFSDDKLSPAERFATLRRTLGEAFEGIEIGLFPRQPARHPGPGAFRAGHRLRRRTRAHPRAALDRILSFLRERLPS
jgi:hypothetical protein